jgi:hypothetical protein
MGSPQVKSTSKFIESRTSFENLPNSLALEGHIEGLWFHESPTFSIHYTKEHPNSKVLPTTIWTKHHTFQ